jgi:hypothetical protein
LATNLARASSGKRDDPGFGRCLAPGNGIALRWEEPEEGLGLLFGVDREEGAFAAATGAISAHGNGEGRGSVYGRF